MADVEESIGGGDSTSRIDEETTNIRVDELVLLVKLCREKAGIDSHRRVRCGMATPALRPSPVALLPSPAGNCSAERRGSIRCLA